MNRFIGLDGHSSSCTFAVLSEKGKTLRTDVVETNGQSLVENLRLVPGRLHLCLEEGTQSQWLFDLLGPHVHEIAVVRGEKSQGNKSDELDAVTLAERMRTGALGAKIFKGAATTLITQMPKNPLYSDYRRLLEEKVKPNLAKLTIARRIAAITLAMWKNKEAYDPAKYQKKAA